MLCLQQILLQLKKNNGSFTYLLSAFCNNSNTHLSCVAGQVLSELSEAVYVGGLILT